jgi:cardiolipin synthase A/B
MRAFLDRYDLWLGAALVVIGVLTSAHAVMYKRESRSAFAWVLFLWLLPGVGVLAYVLLGVNRIKRRALRLRDARGGVSLTREHPSARIHADEVMPEHDGLSALARLGSHVTRRPLLRGNVLTPLLDGEGTYPAMLAAIDAAQRSIALSSYIFADDPTGRRFVDALGRAVARGVQVRVLVDGIGVYYGWPPITRALRAAGVPTARFLPLFSGAGFAFFNLRNHRKLVVVDGMTAFTGGLNLRERHNVGSGGPGATHDVHFRVEGPLVRQLLDTFIEDWAFVTREVLGGPAWLLEPAPAGPMVARTVTDGPDDDFEIARHLLLGALGAARTSIDIVTPYFLPDRPMIDALAVAAMRGVRVRIVLPAHGNIALVRWATPALLWQVLQPGCTVHLTPAPFDHAKMMVVDGRWSFVGSTNWDPRSLRLNFELDVEVFDAGFAAQLTALVEQRIARARAVTLAEMDGRPLPVRLRDGVARLFSPYL